jgi:hypothetical protein
MLDLLIGLATFAYALFVAYARFDLLSTYFVLGAIYAVCVGGLLGSQPEPRIRGYRLHLWIVGICACFILMWGASGASSFSRQNLSDISVAEAARIIAPRVLLLYLGIFLATRASDGLGGFFRRSFDRFRKTPIEIFTKTNLKLRAILVLVLTVSGIWAVVTGDLPSGMSIAKDLVGLFKPGE